MGEYSDAMLSGAHCMQCGDFIGDDCGFPRLCESCDVNGDFGIVNTPQRRNKKPPRRIQDASGRWVKTRRAMTPEEKRADNRERLERRKQAKARKQGDES